MVIEQPSVWLRTFFPGVVWRGDKQRKVVYLTFDDGPIPEATPFVLDTLRERGIRATFFMVGENAERHPQLLEAVRREGHAVGNHTYNHYAGMRHTIRAYVKNVTRADRVLHTRLFRPPYGLLRLPQLVWLTRRYKIVMWDLVTRDYSHHVSAEEVYDNVVRYVRNGSIITFHDSLRSIDKLREVLPRCLDYLMAEGYAFETL